MVAEQTIERWNLVIGTNLTAPFGAQRRAASAKHSIIRSAAAAPC